MLNRLIKFLQKLRKPEETLKAPEVALVLSGLGGVLRQRIAKAVEKLLGTVARLSDS